jgi:hypothetical protein
MHFISHQKYIKKEVFMENTCNKKACRVGWVDIGTRTKVPQRFVTYLSKVSKIGEY